MIYNSYVCPVFGICVSNIIIRLGLQIEHGVIQFQGTKEVKNCQFLLSKAVGSTIPHFFFAFFSIWWDKHV